MCVLRRPTKPWKTVAPASRVPLHPEGYQIGTREEAHREVDTILNQPNRRDGDTPVVCHVKKKWNFVKMPIGVYDTMT